MYVSLQVDMSFPNIALCLHQCLLIPPFFVFNSRRTVPAMRWMMQSRRNNTEPAPSWSNYSEGSDGCLEPCRKLAPPRRRTFWVSAREPTPRRSLAGCGSSIDGGAVDPIIQGPNERGSATTLWKRIMFHPPLLSCVRHAARYQEARDNNNINDNNNPTALLGYLPQHGNDR
jgi:hypothetical protein